MKIRPVDALKLSDKIRALRNFELPELMEQTESEPRYLELLWFIQWVSRPENYTGGLSRFAHQLVQNHLEKLIPPTLLALADEKRVTEDQAALIEKERSGSDSPSYLLNEFGEMHLSPAEERKLLERFAETFSPIEELENIKNSTAESVAMFLRELCEFKNTRFEGPSRFYSHQADPEKGPPSTWPSLCKDILVWMDQRAMKVQHEIAETQVSTEILKWLRRARACGRPVHLTGSCRYGKTETIRCLAKAFPWQYRVVNTPPDQSVQSLCTAIAAALGIEFTNDTVQNKKEKIQSVLDQANIMLIFDESHFLFPVTFTRNTRPRRLDFVRVSILDRGIAAAFISTPQSYRESKRKFEKMTGYNLDQWDGRMLREEPVELPEEITEEEKLAVARIHFPGYDENYLLAVTKQVSVVEGSSIYALIQKVARMSWAIANEHGREKPVYADIKEAVSEVLPTLPDVDPPKPSLPATPTIKSTNRRRHTPEEIFPTRRPVSVVPTYNREMTPAINTQLEPVAS